MTDKEHQLLDTPSPIINHCIKSVTSHFKYSYKKWLDSSIDQQQGFYAHADICWTSLCYNACTNRDITCRVFVPTFNGYVLWMSSTRMSRRILQLRSHISLVSGGDRRKILVKIQTSGKFSLKLQICIANIKPRLMHIHE